MLPIEAARALMLAQTPCLATEAVALALAYGRVLAQDALADLDLPPFARARMDGYALRAADTQTATPGAPVSLRTVGEAAAGTVYAQLLQPGEAVRIMTGAPVPRGADAVQKIEVIEVDGTGTIRLTEPVKAGQFITPRACEARSGERQVLAGTTITPAVAAVLATFGYAQVTVARRPRLALFSTGSELVGVDEKPLPAQIRNSNTYSLAGYARQAGAEIILTGIVPDDLAATRAAIATGLAQADVVMLSGGVSMGDYDLVKPALQELGAEIIVEKVAMHPGKPTVFAKRGEQLIFGLPGNPVSVAVSFHLFALPVLRQLQGAQPLDLPRAKAYLTHPVKGAPPRRSHQPGKWQLRDGRAEVTPLKWAGSSDLVAFMHADCLIVVPEASEGLAAGELAETILLPN